MLIQFQKFLRRVLLSSNETMKLLRAQRSNFVKVLLFILIIVEHILKGKFETYFGFPSSAVRLVAVRLLMEISHLHCVRYHVLIQVFSNPVIFSNFRMEIRYTQVSVLRDFLFQVRLPSRLLRVHESNYVSVK